MAGGYLLDTNILIPILRGKQPFFELLKNLQNQGNLAISVVTRAEILAGMHAHEEVRTNLLMDSLISLPVNAEIADQAGRWIYQFGRQGIHLTFPDALIAATALSSDRVLVTTNHRHFPMAEIQLYPLFFER